MMGAHKLTNEEPRDSLVGMGDRTEYYTAWYNKNRAALLARRREKYAKDTVHAAECRKRARDYRKDVKAGTRKPPEEGVARAPINITVRGDVLGAWTITWLAEGIERSVQTVNYWTKHGLFPDTPVKTPGGNRLYTEAMIEVVKEVLKEREGGLVTRRDRTFLRQIRAGWRKLGVYKWKFSQVAA